MSKQTVQFRTFVYCTPQLTRAAEIAFKEKRFDAGIYAAFRAELALIDLLASELPADVQQRLELGYLKDKFPDCGNTSVSMGCVVDHFNANPNDDGPMAVLNCGSGGIKFQFYSKHTPSGTIRCLAEEKEQKREELEAEHKAIFVSPNHITNETLDELHSIGENWAALFAKYWKKHCKDAPQQAICFVTGNIRNEFENDKTTQKRRDLINEQMAALLHFVPSWCSFSHIMMQKFEAQFEMVASAAVYQNYYYLYRKEDEGETEVIAAAGVGGASVQITVKVGEGCRYFLNDGGMKAPDLLQPKLLNLAKNGVEGSGSLAHTLAQAVFHSRKRRAILAFKSGFALAVDKSTRIFLILFPSYCEHDRCWHLIDPLADGWIDTQPKFCVSHQTK